MEIKNWQTKEEEAGVAANVYQQKCTYPRSRQAEYLSRQTMIHIAWNIAVKEILQKKLKSVLNTYNIPKICYFQVAASFATGYFLLFHYTSDFTYHIRVEPEGQRKRIK